MSARLTFGLTYDYLCPFARNVNEHVLAGLRAGADWQVDLVPFSLSQAKAAEAGELSWEPSDVLGRSGILALAVAELVRVEHPAQALDAHLQLFALRHDLAGDLRDPNAVAGALERAGVAGSLVDRAAEGIEPLRIAHESLVARDVWGVPTLLGSGRAVFVRLLDRPGVEESASIARVERLVELVEHEPMLHEFKQVDLPR